MKLSEKIRAARIQRRLTQEEFAHLLGVSGATVSRWESGTPPELENIKGLARLLQQPIEYFSNDDGERAAARPRPLPPMPPPISWRARKRLDKLKADIERLYQETGEGREPEFSALETTLAGLLAKAANRRGESARKEAK